MTTGPRLLLALFIGVVAVAFNLPARAAVETLSAGQLGVRGDQVSYGARPSISFYLPVFRSARSIRFVATLRVSPAVDPHSTVTVSSGGIPLLTVTVDALRRNPVVAVNVPLPQAPQRIADVTVSGAFSHIDDDVCSRYDPNSLYFVLDRSTSFSVATGPAIATIAGFLETYSGNIAIVVPPNAGLQRRLAAVRLAYVVEQLYRWRHAAAELRTTPDPNARNIFLGDFVTDLAVRGNTLEVGPQGDALLNREIDPLLITSGVDSAQVSASAAQRSRSTISLADLGMTAQTQGGTNPSFSLPFNLGFAGGLPNGLRLSVDFAHTALGAAERGTIGVTINGQLVDSVPLTSGSGRQNVDFVIPAESIAAANDVRVRVDYDVPRDCHISPPNLTTTLFDSTHFHWDSVTPYTYSVGDFFRAASGKMAVLVDGEQNVDYAFALLSTLGTGNPEVATVDVLPFDGTVPKGYDTAIVVAGLDRLSGWPLPLATNGNTFTLGDGAPPLQAGFADPFGVLETARVGGTQTLVASYWKDARPTGGLAGIGFDALGAQTGRAFMYRGEEDIYASTAPRPRDVSQPFLVRAVVPVAVLVVGVLVLVIALARRKRSGGSIQ